MPSPRFRIINVAAALAASALLFASTNAAAQTVVGSVPLTIPIGELSVNPNTDRVYVGGGFAQNAFTVVNVSNPTLPVAVTTVTSSGSGIVVNPMTNFFYTSNGFGGSVLKFDGTTLAGAGSAGIGACPGQFDVDPLTNLIYVTRQCAGGGAPLGVDPLYVINGATMAIVGNNLGSGGVVGSVRVNPTTGRAYVSRSGGVTVFGPSPTFAHVNTLAGEGIAGINPVTNRVYLNAGSNLVVRDGSNDALITTIANGGGSGVAVNTARNRIYSVVGGQISVIDGATNAIVGGFPLGVGVTATGALTVDSVKNRLYAVGTAGGTTRLYVVDDAPAGPGCRLEVNSATYVNGDTVSLSVFRLTNASPVATNVEFKWWLGSDAFAPIALANVPSFPLAANYDQNFGPFALLPVTAALPRGTYEVGCRLLHPVTGKTLSESIATFAIQ
jgi:hypothetical protein